ncbi:chromatin assembly factor 1 subunit A [Brachyhypopomus gauderio]|uniref:chromatin assembly factor 1 subunit A n=1 Tax=Brachyhypopomus gauderio TaxID=698409 RepID=UPI0040423EE6
MVVVMLAAEDPSADGPLASTPRRGMDCVDKANTATKKLVQARLPFKRLNPEPKATNETKRTKTKASGPPTHEPSASDGENEEDTLLLKPRPGLINGCGPLDGFMRRAKCPPVSSVPVVMIDLTEDSNSTDASKRQPPAPEVAPCPLMGEATRPTLAATQEKEPQTSPVTCSPSVVSIETDKADDGVTLPTMDSTLESEPETEPQHQETDVSQENVSALSPMSTSSVSMVESSPEPSKSTPTTPASASSSNAEQKQIKRRSLKSPQEEERQRQRDEKERQKQEARAAKEKQREEARKQKEDMKRKRKEKREKEEQERRERKEKDCKEKAERLRVKEEQRKVKMEAKLEEKRKKEEEKRLKEEKERLKAEKAVITRFLQKPKTQLAPKTLASVCGKFAPFEIKEHMTLAPLRRVQCEDLLLEQLDRYLTEPDSSLDCLKDWIEHKPRKSGATKARHSDTMSSEHRDCVIVGDGPKQDGVPDRKRYGRMKLLHFHENYRPAYWGTWRKKSLSISSRCPFRQDKELLDYEVDSDEEWEEEEPGESLSHSEGDEDDEGGDDDDDDDGFFVPHGYLSDGEGALQDEMGGDPEKQKVRQRLKAREWDELMAERKLNVLVPVVVGCVWQGAEPLPDLLPYAVCMLEPLPREEPRTPEDDASSQQRKEQLLSQLLPLLHGNVNSSKVIITEFQESCRQRTASQSGSPQGSDVVPPRTHVKRLIKENAVYEKRSTYRRCCWYVHADVLARFGQEALPVPCRWTYLTPGANVARDDPAGQPAGTQGTSPTTPQSASSTPSNKRKSASNHSITKYMKRCGNPEQAETMETDGFQADTEDDDDDCIILSEQSGSPEQDGSTPKTEAKSTTPMDTNPCDAALTLPCPTPATA